MATPKRRSRQEKLANLASEIRKQIHHSLPNFNLDLVTEDAIADALRWPGTQKAFDEDGKIVHIARWLPRRLRQLALVEAVEQFISPEKLDPPSAVAYAVAIHLRPQTEPIIQACRQHYWSSPLAPFPFVTGGDDVYVHVREQAYRWLTEQAHGEGSGNIQIVIDVHAARVQQARQELDNFLSKMVKSSEWHRLGFPLATLLRELADNVEDSEMTGLVLMPDENPTPRIDINWSGAVLNLHYSPHPAVLVRVGGSLTLLHQAVRALAQCSFWWTEGQALEYILLGHPPKPQEDQLQRQVFEDETLPGGMTPADVYAATAQRTDVLSSRKRWELDQRVPVKQRTALSDTHLALLQLIFFQPDAKPSALLDQWDVWCRLDDYKHRLASFRGKRSRVPYGRSGRLGLFRRELNRALIRALSFQPLPIGWNDRIQRA